MTVNFYINKANKTPEQSIYVYIRGFKGKTFVYNTGEKIIPKYWDLDKQQAKKSLIGAPELNQKLDSIKAGITRLIRQLETDARRAEKSLTPLDIKEALDSYFNKGVYNDQTLFAALDEFEAVRKNNMAATTFKKITTLRNHLTEFQESEKYPVSFDTINMLFYDKFRQYQWTVKGNTNTTTYLWIKILKIFLNWATERKINTNLEFRKFKIHSDPTEVVYLTNEELFKIVNLDLTDSPRLASVRDTFCFACFTGVRFSDVSRLQWSDIKNNVWHLRTIKTDDILQIPLNGYAAAIIERHKEDKQPLKVISNQKMNDYLKEVCKKAKIDEPTKIVSYIGKERKEEIHPKHDLIGTHTARRTFITLSLEKGMSPEVVMSMTGHKDYKTFKKYIKITDKVKLSEMHRVWTSPNLRIIKD